MSQQNPTFNADGIQVRFPKDWNGETAHALCVVEKVDQYFSKGGSDGISHVFVSQIESESKVTIYCYFVGQASSFIIGSFKFSALNERPLFLERV